MCEQCRKEYDSNGYGVEPKNDDWPGSERYDDWYEDLSVTEFVFYAIAIPPMLFYVWVKDAVFGGARRRAREDRMKLTREQRRVFKDWSGR